MKCIEQIVSRGHLPIIVGGTGLYIQSLIDNYEMPMVPPQTALRERMEGMTLDELVSELGEIDPMSLETVDLKNPRRVMRAIEVATVTGESFREQRKKNAAVVDPLFIGIERSPDELRERINKSIDRMLSAGWVKEVQELHEQGIAWGAPAMTSLGYREIGSFLREEYSKEKNDLEKIISENNLQNRVFLLGFKEDAFKYLKAFDIFLLTSVKEGLPYAILEAGLAECAVIASKIGGIPDIIKNSETGILVTPKNQSEIKRSIEYLAENEQKRIEYGKNLKIKVENDFSLEKMIEKTIVEY
jgi:glycosyltransferase involved in cell wall biosynthesis